MSHRSFSFCVAVVSCAAAACTTTTAASKAETASTMAAAPVPTDPEVMLLRERVARLEKRLVDVDSKLGLLLARGDTGSSAGASSSSSSSESRPLRFDRPRGEQRAVDLGPARGSGSTEDDGLRAIDLGGRGGAPIEDDGAAIVDSSDDGGTVTIKMSGDGGVEASDGDDPLTQMTSAKELYGWGQARMREGRTTEAITAFEDVLGRFGGNELADNALYWIGHCHQQKADHRLAIDAWQKLPAKFPRSDKVPDALFGMAQSHEALGEPAVAEALYDEVVSSYPKAEKLKDAKKALSRLRPR